MGDILLNEMGSHHSSVSTPQQDHHHHHHHHHHMHHSFPRVMQVLTYEDPIDDTSKNELEKLRTAHETYLDDQSSDNNGKLNAHLLASLKLLVEAGIPKDDMSFYFDEATDDDLEKFASNDPWVKAGLIKQWSKQFEVEVQDPTKARRTFNEKFGSHH